MGFAWLLLGLAIAAEVTSTSLLPRTQSFTQPIWTTIVLAFFVVSTWLLSIIVKTLPVSVAYAVWAGVGTAAVAFIGWMFLGEALSPIKVASIGLIVAGVIGLNLTGAH